MQNGLKCVRLNNTKKVEFKKVEFKKIEKKIE